MFREIDLLVDSEGDLVADENGDLDLATSQQTLEQNLLFRVKTDHLDYGPDPFIGANLYEFVEVPNSEEKADAIVEQIGIALSRNPDVPPNLLFIDAVPVSQNSMAAFVMYTGPVEGSKSATIIQTVIEKTITGVDNESIINTTEL